MSLSSGRRLGPYEILSPLGAGGMGEVYKARDTRLDRTVAIKILPEALAGDPLFRERFDREARAISQLDHPHICALYDVGQQDGTAYLVMQYLEGETLAETLTRGRMRLDESLTCASQIANALGRAHRSGIVHRDLKPGNIILTKSGARLLDFGLAKSSPVTSPSGASLLTTTPAGLTVQGSFLGTFQYMAPEQIEGGDADTRSDIWAFGCVLYEMITGSRAFSGKSHASLIASILQSQPPTMRQVQPLASPALDHIVQRCLEKDPEMRWQSIADVGRELCWVSTGTENAPRPAQAAQRRRWILSGLAAVLLLAAGAIAAIVLQPVAAIPGRPHMKLTLLPPPDLTFTPFASSGTPHFALSPDGRHLAFVASATGRSPSLWIRPLGSRVAREIPGSDDAAGPFWSSDGQSIGFFAQGSLKTIGLSGERPTILARVTDQAGGAWSGSVILIGSISGPVRRISATGGAATEATERNTGRAGHRWPQFLPDGRHFIFTERRSSVRLGVLDSTTTTELVDAGGTAVYADTGHLLFVQQQRLMAQAVDRSWKPVGTARQIMDDVRYAAGSGFPPVSISADGLLAYWDGTTVSTAWGWFDRQGKPIPAVPVPTDAYAVRIAPDDGRVAFARAPRDGSELQLWFLESDGGESRFTFARFGANSPVWSTDGREILFTSFVDGVTAVFRRPTSGREQERLIAKLPGTEQGALGERLEDWSRDRRHALVTLAAPATGRDILLISVDTGQIAPLVQTPASEIQARFSPDGRWVAYASDETGRWEVFVDPFPVSGARSQVSRNGGSQPIWRRDGKELFFLAPDGKLMSAAVMTGATFSRDTPRPLFQTRMRPTYPPYPVDYDVTSDAQRFLISAVRPDTGPVISIVTNWSEALKQKP